MPFARPSLPTLIERVIADIESRMPGADARLRRSNLNVFSRVHGGATHGLYGYLDWIARQILPDTADDEILERHAAIWLRSGRIGAASAVGEATATGTDGAVIEEGAVFKRADGARYLVDVETMIAGGVATVALVAETPGQDGNATAATTLTSESPIAGVNATVTVTAGGLTGGADVEENDSLRGRVLERIQQPPHGGAKHDYVAWAKEVPGVTRAWCYPLEMGDGTVTVRFVRDNDASLIPDGAEVDAVQEYIDELRPAAVHLYVVAPVSVPIDFEIELMPDSPSIRAAVEASLRDVLIREAVPEGGNDEGKILRTHLAEAISLSAGENDHVLQSPAADITLSVGEMATFGSITWL